MNDRLQRASQRFLGDKDAAVEHTGTAMTILLLDQLDDVTVLELIRDVTCGTGRTLHDVRPWEMEALYHAARQLKQP
jgi:hypothetical protein